MVLFGARELLASAFKLPLLLCIASHLMLGPTCTYDSGGLKCHWAAITAALAICFSPVQVEANQALGAFTYTALQH